MKNLTDKEIKQCLLDMLDEIDAFCIKNNIEYWLSYGTLIGAS